MKTHIYITPEGSINWIEKMPIIVESPEDAIYFADLFEDELRGHGIRLAGVPLGRLFY
jgi:hypothetical protein